MEPYLGQIMLFAGNFAPTGWFPCDGRLLSIAQYSALYSLLGTSYGGDGIRTFGLPDLRGRSAIGFNPSGGSPSLGEMDGTESVTLTRSNLPANYITVNASNQAASETSPSGGNLAAAKIYAPPPATVPLAHDAVSIGSGGGGQAVPVIEPRLTLIYCIANQGVYPPRS